MQWRIGSISSVFLLLIGLTPSSTGAQAYPPPGYFRLPAQVAGPAAFYGGEGGSCGPANDNCTKTEYILDNAQCALGAQGPRCYVDQYGVKPNVPSHGYYPPYGFYEVDVYPSTADARRANLLTREASATTADAGVPVPILPIDSPISTSEWVRGMGDAAECFSSGAVYYQNMLLYAHLSVGRPVAGRSEVPCARSYGWVRRVLATLYIRASAYASGRLTPASSSQPTPMSVATGLGMGQGDEDEAYSAAQHRLLVVGSVDVAEGTPNRGAYAVVDTTTGAIVKSPNENDLQNNRVIGVVVDPARGRGYIELDLHNDDDRVGFVSVDLKTGKMLWGYQYDAGSYDFSAAIPPLLRLVGGALYPIEPVVDPNTGHIFFLTISGATNEPILGMIGSNGYHYFGKESRPLPCPANFPLGARIFDDPVHHSVVVTCGLQVATFNTTTFAAGPRRMLRADPVAINVDPIHGKLWAVYRGGAIDAFDTTGRTRPVVIAPLPGTSGYESSDTLVMDDARGRGYIGCSSINARCYLTRADLTTRTRVPLVPMVAPAAIGVPIAVVGDRVVIAVPQDNGVIPTVASINLDGGGVRMITTFASDTSPIPDRVYPDGAHALLIYNATVTTNDQVQGEQQHGGVIMLRV